MPEITEKHTSLSVEGGSKQRRSIRSTFHTEENNGETLKGKKVQIRKTPRIQFTAGFLDFCSG